MSLRVLITGGFGYVGGRVAQHLAANPNYEVVLGSRQLRPRPTWVNAVDVRQLNWTSAVELTSDVEDIHVIVHCAGMSEQEAASHGATASTINAQNTSHLVKAASTAKVKKLIYISTAHVYGAPLVGTIDEETAPRPAHHYAESHRAGELIVVSAHEHCQLQGIVVRLSNSFGAPTHREIQRWNLLVNDLCRQAASNHHLLMQSDGTQRRDFIALTDVGRAISHLIDAQSLTHCVYNLGGEWAPPIAEMAQLIVNRYKTLTGKTLPIRYPTDRNLTPAPELNYRIDRLKATGYYNVGMIEEELDRSLLFCDREFTNSCRDENSNLHR